MPISKATINGRLNAFRNLWFSPLTNLGTGPDFTGATEVSYTDFARIQGTSYFPDATAADPNGSQAITVGGNSGWTISNTTMMQWGPFPVTVNNVVGLGLYSAATGGTPVAVIPLSAPVNVGIGERFRYDVGQIDLVEVNI